jgi:pilus assembly protein FimV
MEVNQLTAKLLHWRKSATAVAAAALLGLCASQALALTLGRMAVQSTLGEPLRAEIDLPSITPEEAASLKAAVANPDAYRTAGLDYNPIMGDLQIELLLKEDGRPFLSVTSNRPLNDPFVDLILDARWSSGRIVSYYTLLLDPPKLRLAPIPAPTLAQVATPVPDASAPAIPPEAPLTSVEPIPRTAQETTESASSRALPEVRPAPVLATEVVKPAPAISVTREVTLKTGDTASKIAIAYKASDVSLDQMLVALLRANPDGFVNGNLNRVRAGAVLKLPEPDQVTAIPPGEASQVVRAHSKDFSEYRAKLAASVPTRELAAADRQASGKIQAQIKDKKPSAQAPDKLTLSKAAAERKANEEKIAKEREAEEAAARTQALNKNLEELNKLNSASQATESPPPAAPVVPPPAPVIPADAQTGWLERLINNPLIPAAAGGLIALLAGFGFYRVRKRKETSEPETLDETSQVASTNLEITEQPPTLTEGDVEQPVEISDTSPTDSDLDNPESQLEEPSDLSEATPETNLETPSGFDLEIPSGSNLETPSGPDLEIPSGFDLEIPSGSNLETPSGPDLETPSGPDLETPSGPDLETPSGFDLEIPSGANLEAASGSNLRSTSGSIPEQAMALNDPDGVSLDEGSRTNSIKQAQPKTADAVEPESDIDLDFLLDEPTSNAPPPLDMNFEGVASRVEGAASGDIPEPGRTNADQMDLSGTKRQSDPSVIIALPDGMGDLEISLDGLDSPPPELKQDNVQDKKPSDMLEFDLSSLSLDLDSPAGPASPEIMDDPLVTKLALAEEFNAIGDTDGARAMIEEVIAEATGEMKAKAEQALRALR